MDEVRTYSRPETKLDKKGHIIGVILGIVSIVLFVQGPSMNWSSGNFYNLLFVPFIYLIPIWTFLISIHYIEWWRTVYKNFGLVIGLAGLVASGLNLITALQFNMENLSGFLDLWFLSSLATGITVFLIGLLSINIYFPNRKSNPFGMWMGLLSIVFGFGMILVGLAPGFSAIHLDYTLIPPMYSILALSSILGLIK